MFFIKYLDNNPIKNTLPQVKIVNEWKPIIKSVIKKLNTRASIYLGPKKTGT